MKHTQLKVPTIVLAAVALVVGVSSGAVAGKLITGADVKNGSLTSEDIKNGTLVAKDMKAGTIKTDRLKDGAVTSKKIKDGTIGSNDLSTAAKNDLKTTYAGPDWSIVDRNVVGNGDAFLRAGPSAGPVGSTVSPPSGIGSLGIRTGSASDRAAFGNQVDFVGMDPTTITALTWQVFTTDENIAAGGASANVPVVQFEIDPNLTGVASNFSTLSFIPDPTGIHAGWNEIDGIASGKWFLTGAAGAATNCTSGDNCDWSDVMTALSDGDDAPSVLTVQIRQGDFPFSGAVDALTINTGTQDSTYDFEPFGVTVTH